MTHTSVDGEVKGCGFSSSSSCLIGARSLYMCHWVYHRHILCVEANMDVYLWVHKGSLTSRAQWWMKGVVQVLRRTSAFGSLKLGCPAEGVQQVTEECPSDCWDGICVDTASAYNTTLCTAVLQINRLITQDLVSCLPFTVWVKPGYRYVARLLFVIRT